MLLEECRRASGGRLLERAGGLPCQEGSGKSKSTAKDSATETVCSAKWVQSTNMQQIVLVLSLHAISCHVSVLV